MRMQKTWKTSVEDEFRKNSAHQHFNQYETNPGESQPLKAVVEVQRLRIAVLRVALG